MKEPLRVPFESSEPELGGPRLVHEAGGEDNNPVPSVCMVLHEARLRGGYSVADAARVLRIQEHYLQALEDGRFDEIPGDTYAIGFLRSYSGFLGLEPDEIIESFKRERGLDKGGQRLAFPSPTRDSPRPKLWLVLLVLVLAGLAYGGWQYQSTDGQVATDLVADVSTRLTEAVGLGAADGTQQEAAAGATATTAPEPPVAEAAPAAPAPAESAAAAPEPEAAPAPAVPEAAQEPAPAEPIVTASVEPDPAPTAPAPEPEPAAAATDELLEGVPAAENWREPAAGSQVETEAVSGAGQDAVAIEAPVAESEPAPPPPAKVEAASAVASDEPVDPAALAPPSYPAQPSAPAAASETTATSEVAEASGASGPAAESDSQRPAMVAPLDLASASAGGTDSGEARDAEAAAPDQAAAVDAAPEPAVEAPAQQSASLSGSGDSGDATLVASPEPEYVPKVYGRSNLDVRVVITAVNDSWVQVQGPDNELLLTRILHTGDSYRVPDRPGLVMVTGNAGGLKVRVDDAPAPALGPVGVVLRNIALDPERLLAGTATAR